LDLKGEAGNDFGQGEEGDDELEQGNALLVDDLEAFDYYGNGNSDEEDGMGIVGPGDSDSDHDEEADYGYAAPNSSDEDDSGNESNSNSRVGDDDILGAEDGEGIEDEVAFLGYDNL
jgi:hypothetical protein